MAGKKMTEVSRVVYTRNTPLNYDSYNIYADPLQQGRHFDPNGVYFSYTPVRRCI